MSAKKSEILGENFSTASHRLRKLILFKLLQETGKDVCHRCEKKIETVRELSIEHKVAWQSAADPKESFFDLDNISFSHLSCNSGAKDHHSPAQLQKYADRRLQNTKPESQRSLATIARRQRQQRSAMQ